MNTKSYMRRYQAARRQRKKAYNVQLEFARKEAIFLRRMRRLSSYPEREFYKRALLVGAAFLFNAGGKRGGKKRVKPPGAPR